MADLIPKVDEKRNHQRQEIMLTPARELKAVAIPGLRAKTRFDEA
jgi:hypothetical protein